MTNTTTPTAGSHSLDTDNSNVSTQADKQIDATELTEIKYKTTHTAVRKARRFVVQGMYEWLMTQNAPHEIAARTRATNAMHTVHLGYYHEMMENIPLKISELDAFIATGLDRDISKLDTIEHAILLIGVYELKNSLHIPYKIVFDESMKLNTHFGGEAAHKLINAVLDKLAKEFRAPEIAADASKKA